MQRTAIYGGAFDPIHNGHIELGKLVADEFNIDEFIFVPTYAPPHKAGHTASSEDRLNMLKIATSELDGRFDVSNYEINSSATSYTYNTLSYFKKENLFFVAGSDIFAIIESWYRWRELFELATFIIAERKGVSFKNMFANISVDLSSMVATSEEYKNGKKARIILLKADIADIASSKIRQDFKEFSMFIPKKVLEYIKTNRLYLGE